MTAKSLSSHFGSQKLTHKNLLNLADVLIKIRDNLPRPPRQGKKSILIDWYRENWDIIKPQLGNIPQYSDDNDNDN